MHSGNGSPAPAADRTTPAFLLRASEQVASFSGKPLPVPHRLVGMLLQVILVIAAVFWLLSQMVALPPWVNRLALVLWVITVTLILVSPVVTEAV